MSNIVKKNILKDNELSQKISDIINSYSDKDNTADTIRSLIHDLLNVYNNSVDYGREETIMLSWVANFPDN